MGAMMILWILLGGMIGLAVKRASFRDSGPANVDTAAASALGAVVVGSLFALIANRAYFFDPLSTAIALVAAIAAAMILRRFDAGRDRDHAPSDRGIPPRPVR
jgi:uncharacterized membrane protein YeaQ/YmgE (transglycosylase-associated protein family)